MLNRKNVQILRKAGFLDEEINAFSSMVTPDGQPQDVNRLMETGPWRAMIAARTAYWQQERKAGRSAAAITLKIRSYYRAFTKRRPWDFIKREYHPPKKIKDFQAMARAQAGRRLHHHFGKGRYPIKGYQRKA